MRSNKTTQDTPETRHEAGPQPAGMGWNRRNFLKSLTLGAPAALLGLRGAALGRSAAFGLQAAAPAPQGAAIPALPRAAKPRKIIVIGAGLAGLAAAWELNRAGHDVTVLEAQLRAGGRIHTLRSPFSDGLYAEAGALSFADTRYVRRYIDAFKLAVEPVLPNALPPLYHLRGKRLPARPGEPFEWPFALTPEERKLGLFGMLRKYLAPGATLGDPSDPAFDLAAHAAFDRITLADLLRQEGASADAIELLAATQHFGYGWSTGSALHRLISDVALFVAGRQTGLCFTGGSDHLPLALARALRERIYYGAPVTRIVQQPDKVRAVFRQGGEERTLEADRLICAVPCPVLRRIEVSPPLPERKRRIVAELEYTPVTRTFLQTRTRFWEAGGSSGAAYTDLPVELVVEQPFSRSGLTSPRGILESHLKGAAAERADALDPEARIAATLSGLAPVHPGIASFVEGGYSHSWGADPWAGGGYAWWKPGQLTEWQPELARPEGRLHFAGEHTSVMGRTIEGALESGNRAAREVAAEEAVAAQEAVAAEA